MPARSNRFQKLIYAIEQQLNTKARVVESLMMRDRNGEEREIDVAIESVVGAHPVRIAVECRDRGRPADVIWIDELIGKYRDLHVDLVVAVARAGFTRPARKKAEAHNIRALSLSQATHHDWAQSVRKMASVVFTYERFRIAGTLNMDLEGPEVPEAVQRAIAAGLVTFINPDGSTSTMAGAAYGALQDADLKQRTNAELDRTGDDVVNLTVDLRKLRWYIAAPDGTKCRILGFGVLMQRVRGSTHVPLEHASYGPAAVAYGEGRVDQYLVRAVVSKAGPDAPDPPVIRYILDVPDA